MKLTPSLVFDASTFARLLGWAGVATVDASGNPATGGFSNSIYQSGFVQQNDTGQAVWLVTSLTLTQATRSGANTSYTYSASYTGPKIRIGMSMTVAGFTNGGNNGTQVVTAVTGSVGAGGTFTAANASGVNETHAGTAVTTVGTLPTVQATVTNGLYEIWASNDGGTTFYIKLEYGQCAANIPGMAITFGTSTNGTGTLGGNTSTREFLGYTSATSQGSTTYECDFFSGQQSSTTANGSCFACMMWRLAAATQGGWFIVFERSKTSGGVDTNSYITYVCGPNTTPASAGAYHQCSVFLSGGVATGPRDIYPQAVQQNSTTTSWLTGSNIAASPVFPNVGYFDYPMINLQILKQADVAEGSSFTTTTYGASHTFLPSKASVFENVMTNGTAGAAIAIRWE